MFISFHRFLGVMLLIAYFVVLIRLEVFFPGLAESFASGPNQSLLSAILVSIMPIISIACLLYASKFSEYYTLKSPVLGDKIIAEGLYYLIAYTTFCLVIAVYAVFI